jgi:hypothetical protein
MATIPPTGNMPFIRTDFSNDVAWNKVVAQAGTPTAEGFQAHLQIIDQPIFNGLGEKTLRAIAADTHHAAIFVADDMTMIDPDHPVLCIDHRSGQSFRIVPEEMWGVENNLSIANLDFDDFAAAVDDDGVFRGF